MLVCGNKPKNKNKNKIKRTTTNPYLSTFFSPFFSSNLFKQNTRKPQFMSQEITMLAILESCHQEYGGTHFLLFTINFTTDYFAMCYIVVCDQ